MNMRAMSPAVGETEQRTEKKPLELMIALQVMAAALRHIDSDQIERARDVLTQGLGMLSK